VAYATSSNKAAIAVTRHAAVVLEPVGPGGALSCASVQVGAGVIAATVERDDDENAVAAMTYRVPTITRSAG
jgi:hypothetical protein